MMHRLDGFLWCVAKTKVYKRQKLEVGDTTNGTAVLHLLATWSMFGAAEAIYYCREND
jgi:hypothetical protein